MFFSKAFWSQLEAVEGAAEIISGAVDEARAAGRQAERIRCQLLIRGELDGLPDDDPAREVLAYLDYAVNQGWYRPGRGEDQPRTGGGGDAPALVGG
jgi:hypothetical protein